MAGQADFSDISLSFFSLPVSHPLECNMLLTEILITINSPSNAVAFWNCLASCVLVLKKGLSLVWPMRFSRSQVKRYSLAIDFSKQDDSLHGYLGGRRDQEILKEAAREPSI